MVVLPSPKRPARVRFLPRPQTKTKLLKAPFDVRKVDIYYVKNISP